jgi:ubiquitin carboxyl-terminal hydrolase L5
MNNEDKIDLGNDLLELKSFTKLMDPYMKGLSISNCEKIRQEHNKFSRPEPFVFTGSKKATEKDDVFHFVAYFHFKNNIYEIDGLREGPILIAENVSNKEWVKTLKPSILNRISLYANNEIKFNLLALVPDRRLRAKETEKELVSRRNYIKKLITGEGTVSETYSEYDNFSKEDLNKLMNEIEYEYENNRAIIEEENHKYEKYQVSRII